MHNYGADFDPLASPRYRDEYGGGNASCSRAAAPCMTSGSSNDAALEGFSAEEIAAQFKEVEYWNNANMNAQAVSADCTGPPPVQRSWFQSASVKFNRLLDFVRIDKEDVMDMQRQASVRRALEATSDAQAGCSRGSLNRLDSVATESHLSVMSADTQASSGACMSRAGSVRQARRENLVRSGSALASFLAKGTQEVMAPASIRRSDVYDHMYAQAARSDGHTQRQHVPPQLELV